MFRYNIDGVLVHSSLPINGLTPLTMTDAEAKHCIGFDSKGTPIYNQVAIDAEIQAVKQKQVSAINTEFERQCSEVGVIFEGNYFQYDDTSRSRLAETKDDIRVRFWRSVDNVNVDMSNEKKNLLYKVLIDTYYTKFYEKTQVIDGL